MTLDPIHVDAIARLAGSVADTVDDTDHEEYARRVWDNFLDPLVDSRGKTVVEPLGDRRRRCVDIDSVALTDRPFPTVHGIDSGTINPTAFKNGLVLDLAHAAMGVEPSNIETHRSRSLVMTVHTADPSQITEDGWISYDDDYSQYRLIRAPRVDMPYVEAVVHGLSLYFAESHHALTHADKVDDLLLLDGPLYPKEILTRWSQTPGLEDLVYEARPKRVLENYIRLVEEFVDRGIPLAGFIKNPSARVITRTIATKQMDFPMPWPNDTAFFTRLLEPYHHPDGEDDSVRALSIGRRTEELTFTSWFVSRGGPDETMAASGDALGVDRKLPNEAYEVTFCIIYDPRHDICYKLEAPYAVTKDEEVRQQLTTQMLSEVAAERGPPTAVTKADELARISAAEKQSLRRKFETQFKSESLRTYDSIRWAGEDI